ncbi:putative late blight resistance protein homolog R1B-16, partial [Solanum verrucosum]|uniref:putative late blight resistance protein homolog R1B-16 n=1 Tax=Solanum verrucosum TaxID=315347 RepID=UPI0020D11F33
IAKFHACPGCIIVGMGGQGKTTCARKLYNTDYIVSRFDVQAWCIISQTYHRREILQDIFSQVTGSKDNGDKDDILADKLRKSLMGKRYLILLDDMWDGTVWDDLCLCFPDVENRSRIVVTTRLEKVGEHVKRYTDLYFLPFLTPDDSCKLLQRSVFEKEDCPRKLQDVSQAIAEKCKGLPLVIILLAGIIKRNKMEASWWHEVKNSLLSYLGEAEGHGLSTMQLSYDNLPDFLRPCLLYMGMFPEDARIPMSKLISLWMAEGFVQNIESAEGYLTDLISSNVVMVSRRRYNGKVKVCEVHDVVLHFCLEKSREENFMRAVKGHYSQLQPFEWKESRVSVSFSNELSKFVSPSTKTREPFHQHLRSLITTNGSVIGTHVFKVGLLKVLDLSSHRMPHFSSATLKPLIHLKYLAVSTNEFYCHPESHLPHLETLLVRGLSKFTVLPSSFWKIEKLRHVEIGTDEFENNKQRIFEESSKLENLRILRGVEFPFDQGDSADVLLCRCPNLQELDITFKGDKSISVDTSWVDSPDICLKLESLTELQILRVSFQWSILLSGLQLPSNLKKLVLRGTSLFSFYIESTISVIAELPNLEYLQLRVDPYSCYKSNELCLRHITFHKLKVLKLVKLRVSTWDASEESFPLLETLVIKDSKQPKEIPLSFADIPTLKQIKLIRCNNKFLEASAMKIKEEVEAIEGCDRIDLIIKKKS